MSENGAVDVDAGEPEGIDWFAEYELTVRTNMLGLVLLGGHFNVAASSYRRMRATPAGKGEPSLPGMIASAKHNREEVLDVEFLPSESEMLGLVYGENIHVDENELEELFAIVDAEEIDEHG